MSRKIKWGILGFARIAQRQFIPAVMKSDYAELYAVASRDPEKLVACQQMFKCPNVYESYDALLADPEIDAIYIPLPNSLHKEWAIKAMQQGKHVLCEKPIALNSLETEEMFKAAEENSVLLMEGFMHQYSDRINKVNEIIESGELGTIRYINSTFRFLLDRVNTIKEDPALGGGSLYDVGSYPLNFIGMITNSVPESCVTQSVMENGVDVIFTAVLKYPNGIIATMNSGFNAFSEMSTEVTGTKGRLEIPDTFLGNKGEITVVTAAGTRKVAVAESDRFHLQVDDFSQAIIENRRPLLQQEETLRNMKVMDMLLENIKSRSEV